VDTQGYGKVAVLSGGWSDEREVSMQSGQNIFSHLQKMGLDVVFVEAEKHRIMQQLQEVAPDRVFLALHGEDGESGLLQAILEDMSIPYTSSGVAACAITWDKLRCKWLWRGAGLPTPDFVRLTTEFSPAAVIEQLGLPLVIKPNRDGSSIGVSIVREASQMLPAYEKALACDTEVFAEKFIDGKEYTVSIIGEQVLPSICISTPREFYDYQAKYFADDTEYHCPSGLSSSQEQHIQQLAQQAYAVCGCCIWGRVDFMQDQQGNFYLIEMNTVPGATSHSLVPKAAAVAGMDMAAMLEKILVQTL
jgi:D-alanine-D-alanine ligase